MFLHEAHCLLKCSEHDPSKLKKHFCSSTRCIIHRAFSAFLPWSRCWSLMWCFNFDRLTQSGVSFAKELKSSLKVKVSESESAHVHVCLPTNWTNTVLMVRRSCSRYSETLAALNSWPTGVGRSCKQALLAARPLATRNTSWRSKISIETCSYKSQ